MSLQGVTCGRILRRPLLRTSTRYSPELGRSLHATVCRLAAASGPAGPASKKGSAPEHPPVTMARVGQGFPDWIEKWNPKVFRQVGYGLAAGAVTIGAFGSPMAGAIAAVPVGLYWWVGLSDMKQERQALRRNFPVLSNMRYFFESVRPEIRQYLIESDYESVPFSRHHRSIVYRRAKGLDDTMPFGTSRDVYKEGYEWICHSMYPAPLPEREPRVSVGGGPGSLVKQPYDAALLNVSGMSYGALSDNAILALSGGARLGGFYHNTGEGGVSRFHLEGGGGLVWNVGTGYFGCRHGDGTFSADNFRDTASLPAVKMIEIKLSQGAKPGHGGILPGAKVTPFIAEARGVGVGEACHSPPVHSAFDGARGLVDFVDLMRELSGGKPVGVKMCVGQAAEVAALVRAMVDKGPGHGPDFFTVDGSEGGTGAAPPEFSNSVGSPLVEGLVLVDDLLTGAGLRDRVKVIASGRVLSGFSVVRSIALGADFCNAARAMMFALGCIQALKCGTNHCPTGVATQDPELMSGLVVSNKVLRVQRYQQETVKSATEIIAAAGASRTRDLTRDMIMVRTDGRNYASYGDLFPTCASGSLLDGTAPTILQKIWDDGGRLLDRKPGQLKVVA